MRRMRVGLATLAAIALAASVVVLPSTPAAAVDTFPDDDVTLFTAGHVQSIVRGPDGNMWFTTTNPERIGRISPTGVVRSFPAGVDEPDSITVGPDGNLWYIGQTPDVIARMTTLGVVTTFPDPNVVGPRSITTGPDGNLWFTIGGTDRIGRITRSGTITTFADPLHQVDDPWGITAGPDGNVWFTSRGSDRVGKITPTGTITTFANASADDATSITLGSDGNLWFLAGSFDAVVNKVTPSGVFGTPIVFTGGTISVTDDPQGLTRGRNGTVALAINNPATLAIHITEIAPNGDRAIHDAGEIDDQAEMVALGVDGNFWGPMDSSSIGRFATAAVHQGFGSSMISSNVGEGIAVASNGLVYTTGYDTGKLHGGSHAFNSFEDPAHQIVQPVGLTSGPDGNLWFTSAGNNRIGRMNPNDQANPAATIATFDGTAAGVNRPFDITAGADGNLWFTSYNNGGIGRITPTGVINVYFDPQGNISLPAGITSGPDGNLWFTSANNRIGRITPTAANPAASIVTYDGTAASVANPVEITAGPDGNLWFTNYNNSRIGKVNVAGAFTTYPVPPTEVINPIGITTGPDGNLWFTSRATDRVGRITPAGVVTTYEDPSAATDGPENIVANGILSYTNTNNGNIGRMNVEAGCESAPPANGFTDVASGAFYESGVDWAKCNALVTGFPDGTYRPTTSVNRAQIVNMLWQFMGQPEGSPHHAFADVPANAWYVPALDWAFAEGLVTGFPGNKYKPKEPVLRGQLANMLWNIVERPAGPFAATGYTDIPANAFYATAVKWANTHNLVNEFATGTKYKPKNGATRGEVAFILRNLAFRPSAWTNRPPPYPPATAFG